MATLYSDTYANIPGSASLGDLFLPTDGAVLYYWDGSAWLPWGDTAYQDVQPVNGDFAWLNQGGASTDDTYGPLYLTAPGATVNIRGREKNAPATPYTITGVMMSGAMTKTNYSTYGVYFRETG